MPKKEIVILTDVYDILFAGRVDDVMRIYERYGKKILTGGESECWEIAGACHRDQIPPELRRGINYINAGVVMGPCGALDKMYTWILKQCGGVSVGSSQDSAHCNDQRLMGLYRSLYPSEIAVDTEQLLVANVMRGPFLKGHYKLDGGNKVRHTPNGSVPLMIHFPATDADCRIRENILRTHVTGRDERHSVIMDLGPSAMGCLKRWPKESTFAFLCILGICFVLAKIQPNGRVLVSLFVITALFWPYT